MRGTGLTGSRAQARLSLKLYSTVSVPMMVQQEPSFSSSRLASFGHGDACREHHSSEHITVGMVGNQCHDTWYLVPVEIFAKTLARNKVEELRERMRSTQGCSAPCTWNCMTFSVDRHRYMRSLPWNWRAHLWSWEMGSSTSSIAYCLLTFRMICKADGQHGAGECSAPIHVPVDTEHCRGGESKGTMPTLLSVSPSAQGNSRAAAAALGVPIAHSHGDGALPGVAG